MPNRTEARPAKAVLTYATGRLSPLRLFSTPLIFSATGHLSVKDSARNEMARRHSRGSPLQRVTRRGLQGASTYRERRPKLVVKPGKL